MTDTKKAEPTPGPWHYDEAGGFVWTTGDPYGRGRMMTGQVRGWGHLTGTGSCRFDDNKAIAIQRANGLLIAAAPELLLVAKRAHGLLDCYDKDGDQDASKWGCREGHRCPCCLVTADIDAAVAKACGSTS